eukprot:m.31337 g.31337  ORF g.31337 m.31337 type:complete len:211 (+) comp8306_c0_seq2:419-1051(+)
MDSRQRHTANFPLGPSAAAEASGAARYTKVRSASGKATRFELDGHLEPKSRGFYRVLHPDFSNSEAAAKPFEPLLTWKLLQLVQTLHDEVQTLRRESPAAQSETKCQSLKLELAKVSRDRDKAMAQKSDLERRLLLAESQLKRYGIEQNSSKATTSQSKRITNTQSPENSPNLIRFQRSRSAYNPRRKKDAQSSDLQRTPTLSLKQVTRC